MKCNIICNFAPENKKMKPFRKEAIRLLDSFFAQAKRVTLVTHTHPDGDAVGCTVALMAFLKRVYRTDVRIIYPDPIAARLRFLVNRVQPIVASRQPDAARNRLAETDLLVCLDCNGFSRVEGLKDMLADSPARKVLIDHHLNPDAASFDLVFSETEVSSACELLYHILMALPAIAGKASRLGRQAARALMAGMTTDTNNFANSVWPTTFGMASALLATGVDRDALLQRLYQTYPEDRIRLQGLLLKDLLHITPKGVAYMVLDRQTQRHFFLQEGDTEGFVNLPLAIRKVRMSLFLREENGVFRVSIRSKKGTSANTLAARYFCGGGHELAAGGKFIPTRDRDKAAEAEAFIERITEEFLSE